jgi:predicted nucleotidyltransferase
MHLKTLISKAKLNENDLVAVYCYGSRVYGNYNAHSDYDFIVVTKNKPNEQYSDNLININFYTPEEHQARLDEHEISALECLFLAPEFVWFEKTKFKFKLDLNKLRHALSAKSSNSWVKAKKKLTVEKDYDFNVGRKSLFHSMRIITFGIQIATDGKITNYSASNDLYSEIMDCYTWDEMFEEYKVEYNNLCSAFRKVAPKELVK